MSEPRILVLGAGGTGGYFGGRLAESGADVTFLVRGRRAEALGREGLRIESPFGDAVVAVKTVSAGALEAVYDVVILACKAYDLADALDAIGPGLAADGAVLPFLNGIAHMDVLNARFGRRRVLGGTVKIQAMVTEAGAVRQLNDWRTVTYGEQDGVMSGRVEALTALFRRTKGVEALPVGDIKQRMWEKFVHLATAASMTCLMRANVGEIVRTPYGEAAFLRQLDLSAEVAAAQGHRPSAAFLALYRDTFSQRDSMYSTSMLRDLERQGRTEVDHIIGFMLAKAQEAGIEHQTLLLAYTHVKAFEQRMAAGRLV